MVERVEIEFVEKQRGDAAAKVSRTLVGLEKNALKAGGGARGMNAAMRDANRTLATVGATLSHKVTPSVNLATKQMRLLQQQAAATDLQLKFANRAFGLNATGADAFARASTRAVAALGFISPTAATAASQIQGLTHLSAGATLALAGVTVVAIAAGAALVGSTKAAIDFETSFVGIKKTVEGTDAEFAKLEKQNRSLARSLGENVNEINKVGEAAGSLGVAVKDIARFERIVLELARASDVSTESAAFAFGGLQSILGLNIDQVDSLSDEIVQLGNTFVTTESEILELLNRIAGAGAVLGIPAQDLAGIAAAVKSVRLETEAAGTAVQRAFLEIQAAVVKGGGKLETFSSLLGVTSDEFKNLVRNDPTAAFTRFVEALGRSGEAAQLWLEALDLDPERSTRVFLTLASSGDLLRRAVEEGNVAFQEGTARSEEFGQQLDTTAGELRLAKAAFVDLGISIGGPFLLALIGASQVARGVAALLRGIGDAAEYAAGKIKTVSLGAIGILPDINLPGVFGGDLDDVVAAAKVEELNRALHAGSTEAAQLNSAAAPLSGTLDNVGNSAKGATDALSALFKEPTQEAARAQLAVLGLQKELNALETQTRPLTELEAARADILSSQLIPSMQRQIEGQRLYNEVLQAAITLTAGGLKSQEEVTQAALRQALALKLAAGGFEAIANTSSVANIPTRTFLRSIEAVRKTADELTATKYALSIDSLSVDQAFTAVESLIVMGNYLDALEFLVHIRTTGYEDAVRKITSLQALAATGAVSINQTILEIARARGQSGEEYGKRLGQVQDFFKEINNLVSSAGSGAASDARAMADTAESMKEARTVADALSDGIITLAEAMEFGLSASDAVVLELGHAAEELSNRAFRATVELGKLYVRLSETSDGAAELHVALAEANVELAQSALEARDALNVLYVQLSSTGSAAAEAAVLMAEHQVAAAEAAQKTNVQLAILDRILGRSGLTDTANTVRNAILNLGFTFDALSSDVKRFADAANKSFADIWDRFNGLFNQPTRETAKIEERLARLNRERLIREQGGATDEQLTGIDAEIDALQKNIAIREAELDIMRAQGVLAQQNLLTDQEQGAQAFLLIGLIARESAIVEDLNTQLGWEILAHMGATDAVNNFTSALQYAHGVLRGTSGLSAGSGGGIGGGLAPASYANNVQVYVTVDPQLDDLKAEVMQTVSRELEKKLSRSRFSGIGAASGAMRP